ncbi:DUF1499 domain-containing protein [Pseudodesulfovibrio sp. JC047]|uniref:DUF1499 domain-containing protein n=1 Tax=Pseudodesulfovibrio sp. JC047 TaxID=2683199 RepID=UPI0013D24CEB|nr:DUF1499 domain-containing protein [Pseudodesulfovibrio sp. JC047]NDV20142.1 DUF1499 domain-containing protein [Pseudodesulfovibrio sp. JC047]
MKHTHLHAVSCVLILFALGACTSKVPELGMRDGLFAPCGTSQECLSSQANDAHHAIAPIVTTKTPEIVMVDLGNAIESIFGGTVLLVEGKYLRAEFKNSFFRTVDDAEFYYDEPAGEIQIHILSRSGWFDFGNNRDRIEEIRRQMKQ